MNWKHQNASSKSPRSTEDVIRLAHNFLDQYFASIKRTHSRSHEQRWKEVLHEIKTTGSYDLKETELIFGAKLAWRNAPRCIGRIQWSKLQVRQIIHSLYSFQVLIDDQSFFTETLVPFANIAHGVLFFCLGL